MPSKIIIIGCCGAGKSYFARKLRNITGIPLYHLDNVFWNPDGTHADKECFAEKLNEILNGETWIIDGNYSSTMELRLQKCDTVFFFDLPTEVCLLGIDERKGKRRSDMPWKSAPENDDEEFLDFIKKYREESRPKVLSLLEKYSDKNIVIFNSRKEADSYIQLFNSEVSS